MAEIQLKDEFDSEPYVKPKTMDTHRQDLLMIQYAIHEQLKDSLNFVGVHFSDVNAGGIQIHGIHKDVKGYYYGDPITLKYNFENMDSAISEFVQCWKTQDNPESLKWYQDFIADGQKYGWD